jgi:GT2 family glycosyltransferase
MKLSVIIPVFNDTEYLDRCLAHLGRSVFEDYECIVVDDASTDDVAAVAARHGALLVRLTTNGGPARARNRGAALARGAIILFIDADVCVHPDTLAGVAAHFDTHPEAAAVMGSYDDTPSDPGFVSQYKNLFHHYIHQTSRTEAWTFWAGCGAIRRQVFLDVGGFDESYGRPCIEDIELGSRLRRAGHRIHLNANIQATHLKRWTLRRLVRTDLFDRGIPWILLMLRDRTMPPDMNVTMAHRLSVVLVFALVAVGALTLSSAVGNSGPTAAIPTGLPGAALAVIAAALVALNVDLYRFFARKRGVLFAVGTLPLHWLYYGYCGVAAALGLATHLWRKVLPMAADGTIEGGARER